MKRSVALTRVSWIAFYVGLGATCVVALTAWFGLLNNAEFDAVDWRYRYARSTPEPLSDQIALVVIDDDALDTFGRWPWPRQRLAAAIEEIARAGARTVALDLLLSDPDTDELGDASLAQAMTGLPTVLGVDVAAEFALGAEWQSVAGEQELSRLIAILSSHIDTEPADAADQAKLSGPRRASFLEQPLWFKGMAAWNAIWSKAGKGDLGSLDDLIFELRGANRGGEFDARLLVMELWDRARSWQAFHDEMLRAGDQAALVGGHEHDPPIPQLARTAAGLGVVTNETIHTDSDGAKRRTGAVWAVPGGHCHQFGLAAAATHLGLKPIHIVATEDSLGVGSCQLPLSSGVMVLDWPTSTFDGGYTKWSQEGMGGQERAAVSIGSLIGLSADREQQRSNERARDGARAEITAVVPVFDTPEIAAKSADEFAEFLDESRMNDAVPVEAIPVVEKFLKLFEEVKRGAVDIRGRDEKLKKQLRDKLVFLGWSATGALADFVPTPYSPKTPGVFVHAVTADMVLNNHARDTAPMWIAPIAILLFGGLAALCACRLATAWSAAATLALVAIWLWFAGRFAFNDLHLILPLVGPAVAPVVSWAAGTAAVAILTSRDRARITRQFSARVSPQLVARLANNPDALTVSGQEREITVIFGDLAGFTTISEQLGGPGVVRTLNLYLARLSDELIARDAYVNKFLGDGFMAFWSAFGDEPRQESLAAESAVACQAAMRELAARSDQNSQAGNPKLSVRIGIATGVAVVGDCGAPPKLNDYTAIGDVVNLSSRLESANKQFGTSILMDGATRRGIEQQGGNPSIKIRPIGLLVVVGQTTPIEVFEIVAADADDAWIAATERAVAFFRDQKLAESRAAWGEFEKSFGASKLSKCYVEAIDAVESGQAVADGVLRLRAK